MSISITAHISKDATTPREVIVLCVRCICGIRLLHVTELVADRGVEVDGSRI